MFIISWICYLSWISLCFSWVAKPRLISYERINTEVRSSAIGDRDDNVDIRRMLAEFIREQRVFNVELKNDVNELKKNNEKNTNDLNELKVNYVNMDRNVKKIEKKIDSLGKSFGRGFELYNRMILTLVLDHDIDVDEKKQSKRVRRSRRRSQQ